MLYFCTRNSEGVHRNTGREEGSKEKKFSKKKDSKKLARFEKCFYICTPQIAEKFIERLVDKEGKNGNKFSKKNFKKHLPVKNKFSTFAPALRNKRRAKIKRNTRS
jgi:hypothetical protein